MRRSVLILTLLILGCGTKQSEKIVNGNVALASDSPAIQTKTIESVLGLPADFKSAYKIADTRDVSFSNVKRYAVSIMLPASLKKEEVEQNFKHAILQVYKDKKPNAITIWGYRDGDDVKQSYTVGEAVFAPNGKWESAAESGGSLQSYQTIIKVKDSYLTAKNTISVGDEVTLVALKSDVVKDKDATSVRIWNDYGNRYDSNILAKVPNGTKAKILEVKQTGAGDYVSMVYKVQIKQTTGWVEFFDIKEYSDNAPDK